MTKYDKEGDMSQLIYSKYIIVRYIITNQDLNAMIYVN